MARQIRLIESEAMSIYGLTVNAASRVMTGVVGMLGVAASAATPNLRSDTEHSDRKAATWAIFRVT